MSFGKASENQFKFAGSLDEAIEFLEKAKKNDFFAEPETAYINLAQAYLLKGQVHRARLEIRAALEFDPENESARQVQERIELSIN